MSLAKIMKSPHSYRSTLVSLGILMADHDDQKSKKESYAEYFIPFVITSIQKRISKNFSIDATSVKGYVLNDYGIDIPIHAVTKILTSAVQKKFITKTSNKLELTGKPFSYDFDSLRAKIDSDQSNVVAAFIEYALEKFNESISTAAAETYIISYIKEFSVDCLKLNSQNSALPEVDDASDRELYIVSRFLDYVYCNNPPLFNSFMSIVKGQMLANVLICSDLSMVTQNYSHLTFYFDTPILLQLLQLQDVNNVKASQELIELIKKLDGHLAVFEHTLEEIDNILHFVQNKINSKDASNKILDDLRRRRIKESEITLLRDTVRQKIVALGFTIHPTPSYDEIKYNVDHANLRIAFSEKFTSPGETQVDYDINSIRSIYATRKDKARQHIETCIAIFVTSNLTFARIASDYAKKHNPGHPISSVITDFSLANYSWLKLPADSSKIPETELLKHCFALMQPPEHLWDKYIQQVESLRSDDSITPDQYAKLRYTLFAPNIIMELTEGDEEKLVPQTIHEALEKIDTELQQDKEMALIEKDKEKAYQLALKELELDTIRSQKADVSETAEKRRQTLIAIDGRAQRYSNNLASIITYPIVAVVFLLIAYSLLISICSLPFDLKLISTPLANNQSAIAWIQREELSFVLFRWLIYLGLVGALIFCFFNVWGGLTLKFSIEKIKIYMFNKSYSMFKSFFGISDDFPT